MSTNPPSTRAAEERAKVCTLLRQMAVDHDERGHPFSAGVYRECAAELEGGASLKRDIGLTLMAGRIEYIRDQERKDANGLANFIGHNAPLVLRMFSRADELKACAETIESCK